jgi:hypothetical protein
MDRNPKPGVYLRVRGMNGMTPVETPEYRIPFEFRDTPDERSRRISLAVAEAIREARGADFGRYSNVRVLARRKYGSSRTRVEDRVVWADGGRKDSLSDW